MDGMVSREPHAGFGKEVEFLKLGETLFGREDVHYVCTYSVSSIIGLSVHITFFAYTFHLIVLGTYL